MSACARRAPTRWMHTHAVLRLFLRHALIGRVGAAEVPSTLRPEHRRRDEGKQRVEIGDASRRKVIKLAQ